MALSLKAICIDILAAKMVSGAPIDIYKLPLELIDALYDVIKVAKRGRYAHYYLTSEKLLYRLLRSHLRHTPDRRASEYLFNIQCYYETIMEWIKNDNEVVSKCLKYRLLIKHDSRVFEFLHPIYQLLLYTDAFGPKCELLNKIINGDYISFSDAQTRSLNEIEIPNNLLLLVDMRKLPPYLSSIGVAEEYLYGPVIITDSDIADNSENMPFNSEIIHQLRTSESSDTDSYDYSSDDASDDVNDDVSDDNDQSNDSFSYDEDCDCDKCTTMYI